MSVTALERSLSGFCTRTHRGHCARLQFFFSKLTVCLFICREIDIFIGALNEQLFPNELLIASHAYYYDTLTWCVQIKQPIASWKNIYHVCSDTLTWSLFAISSLCTNAMTFFLQQFDHGVQPKWDWLRIWFDGFRVICGMNSTYNPTNVLTRSFFIFCIFVGIIASTTDNTFILLFMLSPIFEKQVNTVNEIIEQKFDLVGDNLTLQMLSQRYQVNYSQN